MCIYPAPNIKAIPATANDVYRCDLNDGTIVWARGIDVDKVQVVINNTTLQADCWLAPLKTIQENP